MTKPMGAALLIVGALLVGTVPAAAQAPQAAPGAAAPPAAAANPKTVALVRRYLAAVHVEKMVDTMLAAMIPVMTDNLTKEYPNVSAQQRTEIGEIVRETMREDFTPKLLERMIPIYAQTFTESELEAMIAFYESPAGQSIMLKTPTLAPKSAELVREMLPDLQKDMMRRLCSKLDCSGAKASPKARSS